MKEPGESDHYVTTPVKIRRTLTSCLIFAASISLLSCIAAVPIVIEYVETANQTKAEAEMPVPAKKVYSTAVSMAEEKNLKILKKEYEKLYLEVTDGIQTASLTAKPEGTHKSLVTIVGSIPSEESKEKKKKQEKELTLRIIDRICQRLKVNCTVKNL